MTEGGDDEVVPTLSRTGNGSSAIWRPSSARRTSRPIARPLSAPGLLDGGEHVVEPGQVDAVEAGDREVLRHPQAQGLRGPHHAGREEVGLRDDGGGPLRAPARRGAAGRRPPRPRR